MERSDPSNLEASGSDEGPYYLGLGHKSLCGGARYCGRLHVFRESKFRCKARIGIIDILGACYHELQRNGEEILEICEWSVMVVRVEVIIQTDELCQRVDD
jgi:hypothetical protein